MARPPAVRSLRFNSCTPLNTIMNMAPAGCSTYSSEALLASQISRAMYRPRPVPLAAVVKNGSNRCGRIASGTPGAVVGDGQFYPIRRVASAYRDADAAGLALASSAGRCGTGSTSPGSDGCGRT